jgi:hypothetical protein
MILLLQSVYRSSSQSRPYNREQARSASSYSVLARALAQDPVDT